MSTAMFYFFFLTFFSCKLPSLQQLTCDTNAQFFSFSVDPFT